MDDDHLVSWPQGKKLCGWIMDYARAGHDFSWVASSHLRHHRWQFGRARRAAKAIHAGFAGV